LVALHYQPEETSCPTGGVYADQILIIQLLNDVLPKDVHIVVKEHRTQFYISNESASGRSLDFYQRALAISDRVHFVSVDEDPFYLIDRALATITISGTIGWESAIRGTPALVFGRAWYENMPRVFKVKTREELQLAWQKIHELKNKDLTKEVLDFHKTVEANSILAMHYKAYRIYDDVSMSDSINNLVNGLASYLKLEPAEQ
jgi:capsule polysaccharide modification protein KpsS